ITGESEKGIAARNAITAGSTWDGRTEKFPNSGITEIHQIIPPGRSLLTVYPEAQYHKTKSNIVLLQEPERIIEIAQMLDGANPEDTAIEHAKKMLKKGA